MKYKECSVCLDKFKIKNMTETSCHHYFCNDCFFGILHFNKKNVHCVEQNKLIGKYQILPLIRLNLNKLYYQLF